MIDPKDITIIIPHLGADDQQEYALDECLQSLKETVPNIQTILAINGEECGLRDFHKELFNGLKFVELTDQGQCKATNAAVATTNTPWIFVTNDDMIYAPGWWDKLSWVCEQNGKYEKCVSPQLVEPKQGAPTFEVFFAGGAGGNFDKQKFLTYLENDQEVAMLRNGFNLPFLINRELWDTVGGYDINYDPWGSNSDSDLEYKIKLAGIQPKQNTECKVYHFSQTSGTFHPDNNSYYQANFAYFEKKWGFPRTDEGIWEATFSIPTKEQGRKFNPSWENKYGV